MPPKGKAATKGQKAIIEENKSTLKFYQYVMLGVNAVYLPVQVVFFWESFTLLPILMFLTACSVYIGSYKFMSSMARVRCDDAGNVLDGGIDLNMEQGMAEHTKDLILLTAGIQLLSLISNYFWLLYLLAPGRAFYMLWVNILAPWIFAEAPEVDEKKQKKAERKMKRR